VKSSSLYRVAATYAVAASSGDASTMLIWVPAVTSFGVTSCHVLPPSRLSCTSPSSVPTQIRLESRDDGATVKIVP
jgi:hypothetical protein